MWTKNRVVTIYLSYIHYIIFLPKDNLPTPLLTSVTDYIIRPFGACNLMSFICTQTQTCSAITKAKFRRLSSPQNETWYILFVLLYLREPLSTFCLCLFASSCHFTLPESGNGWSFMIDRLLWFFYNVFKVHLCCSMYFTTFYGWVKLSYLVLSTFMHLY
jgi:hypothetical protein